MSPFDLLAASYPQVHQDRQRYEDVLAAFPDDVAERGMKRLLASYSGSLPPFPERLRRACAAENAGAEKTGKASKAPLAYQSHAFEDPSWMDGRGPAIRRLANAPRRETEGCPECRRAGVRGRWVCDRTAKVTHCVDHNLGWQGVVSLDDDDPGELDSATFREQWEGLRARMAETRSRREKVWRAAREMEKAGARIDWTLVSGDGCLSIDESEVAVGLRAAPGAAE